MNRRRISEDIPERALERVEDVGVQRSRRVVVEVDARHLFLSRLTALAAILCLALASTIAAQATTPPAPRQEKELVVRKLSKKERRALTGKVAPRHQDFLADAEPIMLAPEIDAFLTLENDEQRDSFVSEFWRRREAIHRSGAVPFRDLYYRRLSVARQEFERPGSDRGRTYLLQGPPDDVIRTDCRQLLRPIEIWKYERLPATDSAVHLLFYQSRRANEYVLWNPLGGTMAMSELLTSTPDDIASSRRSRTGEPRSESPYTWVNRIQLECKDGHEIMRALTSMIQSRVDLLKVLEPPALAEDEVQQILRSMVIANPEARKLSTELTVRYPGKEGSRTDVQIALLVPRAEIIPAAVGDSEVYSIDVAGEVLRDDSLWERYRYRFDFPGDFDGDHLPIVIDRLLRPAEYVSRIKVTDANSGAEAIVETTLNVPQVFTPSGTVRVEPAGAADGEQTAGAQSAATPIAVRPRLRLIPPPDPIVTGIKQVETLIHGEEIKAVEFWLDGRKVAVRRSAPFVLDLDFGEIPRARRVRAVALTAKNEPITGDEIVVNGGTDPFRVRIESPRVAPHLVGPARIEMDVSVPDGKVLGALDLYWNETRVARLYDPPYIQTIDIPPSEGVGYIRAVATLEDGSMPPVEDVVMINTPAFMEQLEVHLVELPTTVLLDGRPVSDLTETSFRVLDEGKPVAISRFDYVRDLPLSIGLAIDTSGSMASQMEEAQKAGAQFFDNVMRKGDKAFVVAFDEEASLVQKWSHRLSDLHAALAKLRAEERTALHDAVIYALYNFQGVRGQKALVLISDGRDTASKFTFDHALEYARRSGVPIYGIGIGIRGTDADVRAKLGRLASETGGSVFYIEQARELQRVYDDIQAELRSQYVLGFYPPADAKPGKWREITVGVTKGRARTVKGYFP